MKFKKLLHDLTLMHEQGDLTDDSEVMLSFETENGKRACAEITAMIDSNGDLIFLEDDGSEKGIAYVDMVAYYSGVKGD